MYRKTLFSCILFTTMVGSGAGTHQAFAQTASQGTGVSEMAEAIAAYQAGSQGDVIRYLMQRGYEGNVAAQFNLGVINYKRNDKSVGAKEALFWFAEAAEEGDLVAQMNLGMLNVNAGLAEPDTELLAQGIRWLRRSAESGLRSAQVNLGGLIAGGSLDSPNSGEGRAWLELASDAGDPRASAMLKILSESGDSREILALLYPLDEQLRSEPYRGGSEVTTPDALVYAEPSEELQPMATINAGVLVEVLERKADWVRVKVPAGLPVWILANLVKIESDQVMVDRLEAPLYTAPDSAAEAIGLGTVTKGETLQLIENRGEWLMVRSPERFAGWMKRADIASKIVLVEDAGTTAPDSDISTMTPQDSGQPVVVKMVSDAELFQLPERQSELLGVVANNAEIRIVERKGSFVFAEKVQVSGWVSRRLVKLRPRTEAEEGDESGFTAIVNTNVARVRSRPNLQSIDFGRLTRNEEVLVIDQLDGWVRVALGIGSGWIVSQLVEQQTDNLSEDAVTAVNAANVSEIGDNNLSRDIGDEEQNAAQDQLQVPLTETIGEEEQLVADLSDLSAVALVEPTEPNDIPAALESNEGLTDAAREGQSVESETEVAAEAEADTKSLMVKTDSVLYSENSTASTPLGRLNDPVPVSVDDQSAMVQLTTPVRVYGWVFAALAKANGQQLEILRGGVRIRLDPDTERDNIIGARNRGDLLPLLERRNDWLKVAIDPVAGWVLSTDIDSVID